MGADHDDAPVSRIAAASVEPARTRMLRSLLDGRARTGTELAIVGGVSASTASADLAKLVEWGLVKVQAQGRHRYYSLGGRHVAVALEALTVVAGALPGTFHTRAPDRLRAARTCYDHMAGALGVALHDRLLEMKWLSSIRGADGYEVTRKGAEAFAELGVDVAAACATRRRFAWPCLDWSERRPHLAGALGAALLANSLRRGWVARAPASRELSATRQGRRALRERFAIDA